MLETKSSLHLAQNLIPVNFFSVPSQCHCLLGVHLAGLSQNSEGIGLT